MREYGSPERTAKQLASEKDLADCKHGQHPKKSRNGQERPAKNSINNAEMSQMRQSKSESVKIGSTHFNEAPHETAMHHSPI